MAESPKTKIEREIDKAFKQIELHQKEPSKFLQELDLQPLKRQVMRHYTDKRGRSPQYKPVALAHTLIFQRLLGLKAVAKS